MPFSKTSFLRSFRFRVMAWLFVVVVGTMVLTTFLVRAVVEPSILKDFDGLLRDEAVETIADIRALYPKIPSDWRASPKFDVLYKILERRANSRVNLGWFIRVVDADGGVIYQSKELPDIAMPSRGSGDLPHENAEYRWVDVPSFESPERTKGPPAFWVQTGRSREPIVDDVNLINRTLLIRGLFVILLAPLGGYWLARQVTGPIANIIVTASRLQPKQLNERLPIRGTNDELDRVSATINGMLDRIADYIEKNRAFVANAAHELRSPLAAIRSSAEVALNRSRTPEEYATVLTDMIEETGRLSSMVNRLLLLAESDAGRTAPALGVVSRIDKVVRESIEMFQAVAEARDVNLVCEALPPLLVMGEEASLRHVVRNLIDNAIKYTPAGKKIILRLSGDNESAYLAVEDEGCGIEPADLPRVFERFFRGDRSRHRDDARAGTGLGLSICHAIVTGLGGEIRVNSELGKGSTFHVSLPLAKFNP